MGSEDSTTTALVLSGGGARGGYQAGAIKALTELADRHGYKNPFPIITGTSAGAINASFLAAHAGDLKSAGEKIGYLWGTLKTEQVIRTDTLSFSRIGFRLLKELTTGSFVKRKRALSLLDSTPLRGLLSENIAFEQIQKNIEAKRIRALAINATNYANSNRVTFVQGVDEIKPWKKVRRFSEFCQITADHVMASTAIPVFFPPIEVSHGFFGDGCLRNLTPLSPAIKLGADKLIIVGVQKEIKLEDPTDGTPIMPTLARVVSVITNAILMDNIFMDIERLLRINDTLNLIQSPDPNHKTQLRPVHMLHIRPSDDIGRIAFEESENLPSTLKFLIDGLGSRREAAELISYLLFEGPYCQRLIDLGYHDTMKQEEEILKLFAK